MTRLAMTRARGALGRRVAGLFLRVLCTSRSMGVGGNALRMDGTACRHTGRLFGRNDVSGTSLTRLRTRINGSRCRLMASRDSLEGCGLRLGRVLRLSKGVRVRLRLPMLSSRGIVRLLPGRSRICRATLTGHPRVRDDGLDVSGSGLTVSTTGDKCCPDVDLSTSASDVAGGTDRGG